MIFWVDRRAGTPVYLQLVQQVRQGVLMGRLAPGDQLPTAREVSQETGVNPNTVLKAYGALELAGLVESRQGSGTFVRDRLAPLPDSIEQLRPDLAAWVARAHAAGLDVPDMQALVADVAARTLPARERAPHAG